MNKCYGIVWNTARNMFMVVAEFVRSGGSTRRRVRIFGGVLNVAVLAIYPAHAEEIGPQSGASITIQDGDTITSTSGVTGINSVIAGGTGVQISGKASVNVSGNSASMIGINLDNGASNNLGRGTQIAINNSDTASGEAKGIVLGKTQSNTDILADSLNIDVKSASGAAYGIQDNGIGGRTDLGKESAITVSSVGIYPVYGIYLNDGSGDFKMDGGSIAVTATKGQTAGLTSSGDANVDLGTGTQLSVTSESSTTGISVGESYDSGSFKASKLAINVTNTQGGKATGFELGKNSRADLGNGSAISLMGNDIYYVTGILVDGGTFTANDLDLMMATTDKVSSTRTLYGVDVKASGNVDLGSGSTITASGFSSGKGIEMETKSGTFTADHLTVDINGGGGLYGIQMDGGKMDLGTGSSVSAAGTAETIWITGGSFTASELTVKTQQSIGINVQGVTQNVTANIGAGSVVDGRIVGKSGSTSGISATDSGIGGNSIVNFNGSVDNRNTIYAVNGYGASAQFSGQKITISNTDIIMSGEGKPYGLWAIGDNSLTSAGIIDGENLMIDMVNCGPKSVGIMVQQGGIINLSGDTTIKTDSGIAIRNAKITSNNGATLLPGGTITGTGKMDITGDIISDGWGSIDLTMAAGSYFVGATSVNPDVKKMNANATSTLNLQLADDSQWVIMGDSSLTQLTNAGKLVFDADSADDAYSTLSAENITLQNTSELDLNYAAAARASANGIPIIVANDITLNGSLHFSDAGLSDLKYLTSDLQLPNDKIVLIDADTAINGNFSSLSEDSDELPDYLAFSGQINPNDATQYLLGTGLSWYVDDSPTVVSSVGAHGNFTLDTGHSFEVTNVLKDVAPDVKTGWDGKSLTKKGDGTLFLGAENTYSGITAVQAGTLWLRPQASIGVAGSQQPITIAEGAAFGGNNATVNGQITNSGELYFDSTLTINGDVTNNGAIVSESGNTPPSVNKLIGSNSYNTLLINGNYSGSDGSLTLSTYLGDDTSATEQLKITGDTSGNTTLYIKPTGGEGAITTNGIAVVDIDGASNGVFTQGNQVQAGLYEYRLYKDEGDGDWYLRSQAATPPDPDPDDGGDDGGDGGDVPVPPTPVNPQYRPDIGVYIGNQWMVRNLQMQTLSDREGSQYRSSDGSVWARFKAGKAESRAVGGNVDIESNYSQFQLGSDILAWQDDEQSFTLGLMGSYINANTDSTGNRGADGSRFSASGNVDGYNMGIYATWFADAQNHSGLYLDSWYQYGIYKNSAEDGGMGAEDYDSSANAISLETGYRYAIALQNQNSVSLTPQVQITWQDYRADGVTDSSGTRINDQNSDNWTARLGLRVDDRRVKDLRSPIQPFVEVNWLHTHDDIAVAFNGSHAEQELPPSRGELIMGIEASVNEQWYVRTQIAGQKGSDDYSDLSGSLNLRYNW